MYKCLDVNECESNPSSHLGPCINAASCQNTPGAFSCTCLEGWGGPTCAKDIDDCLNQCKNGATCIDLVNDYHCACAAGFTGLFVCLFCYFLINLDDKRGTCTSIK